VTGATGTPLKAAHLRFGKISLFRRFPRPAQKMDRRANASTDVALLSAGLLPSPAPPAQVCRPQRVWPSDKVHSLHDCRLRLLRPDPLRLTQGQASIPTRECLGRPLRAAPRARAEGHHARPDLPAQRSSACHQRRYPSNSPNPTQTQYRRVYAPPKRTFKARANNICNSN